MNAERNNLPLPAWQCLPRAGGAGDQSDLPCMPMHHQSADGFTLVELVMVMIVVGILAAVVMPKFANINDFEAVGYGEQLMSLMRFAQKTAIAQRTVVYIDFGAQPPTVTKSATTSSCAAGTALALPGGSAVTPSSTVTVTSSSGVTKLCFDGLGKPYAPTYTALTSAVTVTVKFADGSTARSFTVEPETGYVHP